MSLASPIANPSTAAPRWPRQPGAGAPLVAQAGRALVRSRDSCDETKEGQYADQQLPALGGIQTLSRTDRATTAESLQDRAGRPLLGRFTGTGSQVFAA